jgi:hypothetical protein
MVRLASQRASSTAAAAKGRHLEALSTSQAETLNDQRSCIKSTKTMLLQDSREPRRLHLNGCSREQAVFRAGASRPSQSCNRLAQVDAVLPRCSRHPRAAQYASSHGAARLYAGALEQHNLCPISSSPTTLTAVRSTVAAITACQYYVLV